MLTHKFVEICSTPLPLRHTLEIRLHGETYCFRPELELPPYRHVNQTVLRKCFDKFICVNTWYYITTLFQLLSQGKKFLWEETFALLRIFGKVANLTFAKTSLYHPPKLIPAEKKWFPKTSFCLRILFLKNMCRWSFIGLKDDKTFWSFLYEMFFPGWVGRRSWPKRKILRKLLFQIANFW